MVREDWHLSRSVPITLIVTIFIQTVAVVWFASELRFDVNRNKEDILETRTRLTLVENSLGRQAITLGRIDENLEEIRRTLERIEKNADGRTIR